jgi:Baseplate J-like protein
MRDLDTISKELYLYLRSGGSSLVDSTPQSVTYTLLRSFAAGLQQLELQQESQLADIDLLGAKGLKLEAYCRPFGIFRQQAISSRGWVLISANVETTISAGALFTELGSGAQFIYSSSLTINLVPMVEQAIPVIAVGIGSAYNLQAGTSLYSSNFQVNSVVVGYERKYDGLACGDIAGGELEESDVSLRQRWTSVVQAGGAFTKESLRTLLIQHPQVIEAQITTPQPGIVMVVVTPTISSSELIKDLENLIRPYLVSAIVVVKLANVLPLTVEVQVSSINNLSLDSVKGEIEVIVKQQIQLSKQRRYLDLKDLELNLSTISSGIKILQPEDSLSWDELTTIELGSLYVNFRV